MFEGFVFGPRVDSVKHDAFLTGRDEIFGFGDSLASYPILTFGAADHFAKFTLVFAVRGALDAAFFHFFINHIAEVDFGNTSFSEVINKDRFTTATHANDGKYFDVFGV